MRDRASSADESNRKGNERKEEKKESYIKEQNPWRIISS
jgi:hypothetical protein